MKPVLITAIGQSLALVLRSPRLDPLAAGSSYRKLQALLEQRYQGYLPMGEAASLPVHAVVALRDFDRRCFARISARSPRHGDEIKGKRRLELRDARFALASPSV